MSQTEEGQNSGAQSESTVTVASHAESSEQAAVSVTEHVDEVETRVKSEQTNDKNEPERIVEQKEPKNEAKENEKKKTSESTSWNPFDSSASTAVKSDTVEHSSKVSQVDASAPQTDAKSAEEVVEEKTTSETVKVAQRQDKEKEEETISPQIVAVPALATPEPVTQTPEPMIAKKRDSWNPFAAISAELTARIEATEDEFMREQRLAREKLEREKLAEGKDYIVCSNCRTTVSLEEMNLHVCYPLETIYSDAPLPELDEAEHKKTTAHFVVATGKALCEFVRKEKHSNAVLAILGGRLDNSLVTIQSLGPKDFQSRSPQSNSAVYCRNGKVPFLVCDSIEQALHGCCVKMHDSLVLGYGASDTEIPYVLLAQKLKTLLQTPQYTGRLSVVAFALPSQQIVEQVKLAFSDDDGCVIA